MNNSLSFHGNLTIAIFPVYLPAHLTLFPLIHFHSTETPLSPGNSHTSTRFTIIDDGNGHGEVEVRGRVPIC